MQGFFFLVTDMQGFNETCFVCPLVEAFQLRVVDIFQILLINSLDQMIN